MIKSVLHAEYAQEGYCVFGVKRNIICLAWHEYFTREFYFNISNLGLKLNPMLKYYGRVLRADLLHFPDWNQNLQLFS